MSTTERGRQAESLAASYLQERGLEIVDRNWRTRWCELDLVAHSSEAMHFVEIKYRANPAYGTGFDYITRDKQDRLARAVESWCQHHRYTGAYQIDIISVAGDLYNEPPIEWLPNAVTD